MSLILLMIIFPRWGMTKSKVVLVCSEAGGVAGEQDR